MFKKEQIDINKKSPATNSVLMKMKQRTYYENVIIYYNNNRYPNYQQTTNYMVYSNHNFYIQQE